MSIRYIKQLKNNDCGPTAIFNILRWAGASVSVKKHKPYLDALCIANQMGGTLLGQFNAVMSHMKRATNNGFSFKYIPSKKPFKGGRLTGLDSKIEQGGSAAVLYWNGFNYHYMFISGVSPSKKTFTVVNGSSKSTVSKVRRSTIKHIVNDPDTTLWLINRYNK